MAMTLALYSTNSVQMAGHLHTNNFSIEQYDVFVHWLSTSINDCPHLPIQFKLLLLLDT